jgi:hypothetical protein
MRMGIVWQHKHLSRSPIDVESEGNLVLQVLVELLRAGWPAIYGQIRVDGDSEAWIDIWAWRWSMAQMIPIIFASSVGAGGDCQDEECSLEHDCCCWLVICESNSYCSKGSNSRSNRWKIH